MTDDKQDLYDEFFERIVSAQEITPEARLMAAILDQERGTEGTPSGSQCPLMAVPGHTPGDKKMIYVVGDRPQIALANEVGDLVNVHIGECEHGDPEIHIAVNGTEVAVPLEYWLAASMIIEGVLDDED